MDINKQLCTIYKLNRLPLDTKQDGCVTNPLLLSIPQDCINKPKIMLFGQETNDWHCVYDLSRTVENEMESYNNFWFDKKSKYSKQGTLMQTFDQFQQRFQNDVCFVWNNTIKIGKTGIGTPSNEIIAWQKNWFDVIKQEVDLLQPIMILFFSGPNYDKFIQKSLGEFTSEACENEKKRSLAKLTFKRFPHIQAYRTYHPQYLQRSKLKNKYIELFSEYIQNQVVSR